MTDRITETRWTSPEDVKNGKGLGHARILMCRIEEKRGLGKELTPTETFLGAIFNNRTASLEAGNGDIDLQVLANDYKESLRGIAKLVDDISSI